MKSYHNMSAFSKEIKVKKKVSNPILHSFGERITLNSHTKA